MNNVMTKIINRMRLIKLNKRLFLSLVIAFSLSVTITGISIYNVSKNIVLSTTQDYLSDYITQLNINVDNYIQNIVNNMNELTTNVEVINSVRSCSNSKIEDYSPYKSIIDNKRFSYTRNIDGFIGVEVSTLSKRISYLQYQLTTGNIKTSKIMQDIIESSERITFFNTMPLEGDSCRYTLEKGKALVIGSKINYHTNGNTIGMAILAFSESSLYDIFHQKSAQSSDVRYITDANGIIISSGDKDLIGQPDITLITDKINNLESNNPSDGRSKYFNIEIDNTDYMIHYCVSNLTGWRIISMTNMDVLLSQINQRYFSAILFSILCAIMLFLFSILVTKSITLPINSIIGAMHTTSVGNKYPYVEITGNDEITYLGITFNEMSQRIQLLIEETAQSHEKEKQAEFKALQSQINPHFLYNTLDSVNWLAYMSQNQEICDIINSLSTFFRLSLNKGNDFYKISDEVKHINCYINIQRIIHNNRVSFSVDVDDRCLDCITLKILLQPIIENAICHGIEPKGGKGHIDIKIALETNIIKMTVVDDGVGIRKEFAEIVSESAKNDHSQHGYGLANIQDRIQLYYGSQFGLNIKNNDNVGTIVTIIIPSTIKKGSEEHENSNH